jgi:hypothetical protein
MASFLYTPEPDEQITLVKPKGSHWSLEELQKLVGGYIEIIPTIDNRYMVINELGKVMRPMLPLNKQATRAYLYGRDDWIAGPAVIVDTKEELDGPEDADEGTNCGEL